MTDSAETPADDGVTTLAAIALDLPRAYGAPPLRGRLRVAPADFEVVERLGFEPDGEGEHWLLEVRKTGWNTDDVARRLARHAGVHPREVGYCGLKDRQAVTTQWFSVRMPRGEVDWSEAAGGGIELLGAWRHRQRLRRGIHRGNAFRIVLRSVIGDRDLLCERLAAITVRGVPNAFGVQRFGHGGANLHRARSMLLEGREERSRQRRGLWLSAARSALFNAVLAHRVREGTWDRVLDGEEAMLDGSRSRFVVDRADDGIRARAGALDLHPSGPLWGRGERRVADAARRSEDLPLAPWGPWRDALERAGLEQERRPLRMVVRDLHLEDSGEEAVTLRFVLGRGEYATAVLREIADVAPLG